MGSTRLARSILVTGLALLLGACFDEPVRERLAVEVLGDGRAVVTVTTDLAVPESGDPNPSLSQRLDQLRFDLEAGSDPWSPRFKALDAKALRTILDHQEGRLVRARRRAIVEDSSKIERFFADTLIQAYFTEVDGWAEVSFQPLAPGRANRRQRRMLDRGLAKWTDSLAAYLAAAGDLWDYLDERPNRSRACFAEIFSELLPDLESSSDDSLELDPGREEELIETLGDAMGEVLSVLVIERDQDYSLDEISRLVFDPFPAALTIRLPSRPTEVEGFVASGNDQWSVPTLSLWQALRRLEGRWLDPDLLVAYVEVARAGDDAVFDLDRFADAARFRAPTPRSDEIREAIDEQLRPAPIYRALVKLPGTASPSADEVLDGP